MVDGTVTPGFQTVRDAVARFYAGLVAGGELNGVRLVSPATIDAMTAGEMTAGEMTGPDLVFEEPRTWGLGVWVEPDGYGMGGLGGSLGMADPELGLAEAYYEVDTGSRPRRCDGRGGARGAGADVALLPRTIGPWTCRLARAPLPSGRRSPG